MARKFLIYDEETFSNCFTIYFMDWKTKKEKAFVIHESRNDLRELMHFLDAAYRNGYYLVGFNCNAFDAQILEFIIYSYEKWKQYDGDSIAREIYTLSQKLINLPKEERFNNLIPEWKFNLPHIDIFKQKHYDGVNKSCSLKWLQFTMRFPLIEGMPIKHDTFITEKDIPKILQYNGNDVRSTYRSFEINQFESDLRFELSQEYGLNLINASEPKLARDIFGKFLSEAMDVPYRTLKERRSERDRIYCGEIIFPYVKFKDPILNAAKDFYANLDFNPSYFESNNYGLKEVNKTFDYHNLKEVVVGLGGIHGCIDSGIYTSRPNWVIRDIDATSYYPNLGIENDLFPEHLSIVFCHVYKKIFDMRQTIDKKNPINYVFKIILNSAYGLSKESNNYFYDPKYTFSITINGQLLLLMLAEKLKSKVKDIIFYQLNTDGVTIGYDPKYKDTVDDCMKWWTKTTRIKLEDKYYEKMVIRDVNNYLAVDTKGGVKRKGLFGYSLNPEDKEMDYHKNPSMLVVPKALEAYFVKGTPIEDYIKNCKDIYDFCLGSKVKGDFELIRMYYDQEKYKIQQELIDEKVVRYYVSHENAVLKKRYKKGHMEAGRTVELQKGWNSTYFNTYVEKPIDQYGIDYSFYISKAKKIVQEIEGAQISMFGMF